MKLLDLTGQVFGRLTVINRAESDKHGHSRWECRCTCGTMKTLLGYDLTNGNTSSCGCLAKEKPSHKTHGLRHSRIYNLWANIKKRCFNPNNKSYHNYGGRGITMYPAWIDNFLAFYNYVSQLNYFGAEGYSLDRINNNGNYEPGNLRWATRKEQSGNTRRNVIVEYQDKQVTLTEAAVLSGIQIGTLWRRYQRGDTGERLFRPVEKHK